jgi:hypothetical protein
MVLFPKIELTVKHVLWNMAIQIPIVLEPADIGLHN